MPNLAQITIAGHAGGDANLKYLQDGTGVCDFSVAVNNRDDSTTWYRVTVWGKYGEIMSKIVKKGATVTVIGDFAPRTYTDNNGQERTSYDVRANHVIVAGEADSKTDDKTMRPEFTKGNGSLNPDGDDIPF